MSLFKIISLERIETWLDVIEIGQEINSIEAESIAKAKEWAYDNYGPKGEDIKYKVIKVKE